MKGKEFKAKKLTMGDKMAYGFGDFGCNYCWSVVAMFFMLYCTDILGIRGAVVGTLMAVSRLLDGVSDVIMGKIIDNTEHKMGKARFWMFVSAFPVALSVFLLFSVPGSFSENTKYIYIFIIYTLMGAVFYTMNNIAYSAFSALITKDPIERVSLGSYRFIFTLIACILISVTTTPIIEFFGGGRKGWTSLAVIYAIICLVTLLIPVVFLRELPPEELAEEEAENSDEEKIGLIKSVMFLLKNRYFLLILALYLVEFAVLGIMQGMGIYYATYILGNPAFLGITTIAQYVPMMLVLMITPKLTEKFGMWKTCMWSTVAVIAGGTVILLSGNNVPVLLIGMAIFNAASAPRTGIVNAFIAEASDYSYLKFGYHLTGMIFACASVGMKAGTGLGTALCGLLLDMSGYDGLAATQTEATLHSIQQLYLTPSFIAGILFLVVIYFLNVEKVNKKLRAERTEAN